MKKLIWGGVFVGSTIGGAIPYLWGSYFSFSTVWLSGVGGIVGIYVAYKIGKYMGV